MTFLSVDSVPEGLARSNAVARILASGQLLISGERVGRRGEIDAGIGMADEPQELVCPVVAAMRKGFQVKTMGCRGAAKL